MSVFYLRGESGDRTRQDAWLDAAYSDTDAGHVPMAAPKRKEPQPQAAPTGQGTIFDSFLKSKQFRDLVRETVTEVLRSRRARPWWPRPSSGS